MTRNPWSLRMGLPTTAAFVGAQRVPVRQDARVEFIAGTLFGIGLCLLWSWASARARG